jgi:uncharacterized membrane protein
LEIFNLIVNNREMGKNIITDCKRLWIVLLSSYFGWITGIYLFKPSINYSVIFVKSLPLIALGIFIPYINILLVITIIISFLFFHLKWPYYLAIVIFTCFVSLGYLILGAFRVH